MTTNQVTQTAPEMSTRQRIVQQILSQGPQTARALADELGLTPAAIRRHLTALLEDGTLEDREQRVYGPRGRGRPSKVFALTDRGRSEFHQAYDEVAISAIRHLLALAGPDAVQDLARDFLADVEQRFHALRAESPERAGVELLAEALGDDGFAPTVLPVVSGDQLCQHHCPVAHVAAEFPMLCEVETQIFSRLLGSHVQRIATIAHGDGVCTTHVPKPLTTTTMSRK